MVVPGDPEFDISARPEHDPELAAMLRAALLRGELDLAVHAVKDLPFESPPGIVLAAVPMREDPRDCLVATRFSGLSALPAGARVGVDTAGREAAVRALRSDVEIVRVVGPLASRVERVERGDLEGLVVALAAMRRAGLHGRRVAQVFSLTEVLPAA